MRVYFLLLIMAFQPLSSWAQLGGAGNLFLDQSSLNGGQAPVDLYHGKPNITIPIETLRSGSYSLAVGLSYDAGGIKVNQMSGNAGLGWTLSAGGSITRFPNGSPDELINTNTGSQSGYIKTKPWCDANPGQPLCITDPSVWTTVGNTLARNTAVTNYGLSMWHLQGTRDPAPDKFIFNVGKTAFSFIFTPDGQILCDNNARIEYTVGRRAINYTTDFISWVVTLDDGIKYYFCTVSKSQARSQLRYGAFNPNGTAIIHLVNQWCLTKIDFPDGRPSIDFEYLYDTQPEQSTVFNDFMPEFYDSQGIRRPHPSGYLGEYQCTMNFVNYETNSSKAIPLVSKISTNEFNVQFTYDLTIQNYRRVKPLTTITVIGKNGIGVRQFDFSYTRFPYPQSTAFYNQFLLNAINIHSVPANPSATSEHFGNYSFDYMTNQPFELAYDPTLVSPNTTGVDHWGYYSGVLPNYNSLIPGIPNYGSANNCNGISSRAPNPVATQALCLKKITYPTGGWVEYEYENNDYRFVSDGQFMFPNVTAGGLRVKSIRKHDAFATSDDLDVVKRYEYTMPTNPAHSSGVIEKEPVNSFFYQLYPLNAGTPNSGPRDPFSLRVHSSSAFGNIEVGYGRVSEINNDGSKTVFIYSTSRDYPHEEYQSSGNGTYIINTYSSVVAGTDLFWYVRYNHPFIANAGKFDFMRGLLQEKHMYDNQGGEVYSEVNTYLPHLVGHAPAYSQASVEMFSTGRLSPSSTVAPFEVTFAKVYDIGIGFPQKTSTVTKVFDLHNATRFRQTTTTFQYNPTTYLLTSQTTTDSNGNNQANQFFYTSDYNGANMNGIIGTLQTQYILNRVVESRTLRYNQNSGQTGTYVQVGGFIQEYEQHGLPTKTYLFARRNSVPSAPYPFLATDYLNNVGNYSLKSEKTYHPFSDKVATDKSQGSPTASFLWNSSANGPSATVANSMLSSSLTQTLSWMTSSSTISATPYLTQVIPYTNLFQFTLTEEKELNFHIRLTKQDVSRQDTPIRLKVGPLTQSSSTTFSKLFFTRNNTNQYDFTLTLPADTYQVSAIYESYPSGPNSDILVETAIDLGTRVRQCYYTSFEDDATATSGVAKTGSKAHYGPFIVPIPNLAGSYVLTYWESPLGSNNWVFHQEAIVVTGSTSRTIGSNTLIDDVRLVPAGAQMASYTYDPVLGKTSEMTPNGLTTSYDYDSMGRLKVVHDDKGNIVKSFEYHNQ